MTNPFSTVDLPATHSPPEGSGELIDVLNLGAGVQSSTVLLMSLHGELPPIDHAIFADTGWEPAAVYKQMDWLEGLAVAAGIQVHRVEQGNIKTISLEAVKAGAMLGMTAEQRDEVKARGAHSHAGLWASMPYFTVDRDGNKGMLKRQCTNEFKIRPIERFMRRELLNLRPRQRAPKEPVIRRWYGISLDEQQRTTISKEKWAVNWYPLIEKQMTRTSCYQWLADHNYHEAPRSACIACPYRHNREWREMKEQRPDEWQEAIEFDKAIRKCGGMRGDVFVHSDRKPLDEVNLWKDYDENQLPLFDMVDECSGMCGV